VCLRKCKHVGSAKSKAQIYFFNNSTIDGKINVAKFAFTKKMLFTLVRVRELISTDGVEIIPLAE
jgi:hypothetical protein